MNRHMTRPGHQPGPKEMIMKSNSSDRKSTSHKKNGTPDDALKHLEKSSDTEKEINKEKPDGDTGKKSVFKWSGKP